MGSSLCRFHDMEGSIGADMLYGKKKGKKKAKKGYHRMANGKLMKGSKHPKRSKKRKK